jgi:hypothetical protein
MTHTPTATADPAAESSGDLLDEEWLAAPTRRSRLRGVLVVLLAASLVFLAGVEVQRRFGDTSASSPSAATGAFPAGGPGGGLPSGFPDSGAGGTQPDTSGSSGTGDEAAVIGTVESVKGEVWTIKDLGGKLHEVTVTSTVRIVRESSVDAADVETGATVDIAGTTGDDGEVTATSITLR